MVDALPVLPEALATMATIRSDVAAKATKILRTKRLSSLAWIWTKI
ncbi:MAG TPA: hypothetical protein VHV53_10200 [Solirubrobacterales bacterium]|nr:hypothetical protein [Solirubrobacterales bacterium]